MSLFRNKYRIESARWQNWNYANAGAYFVTICTHDREHYFGEIVDDGTMVLSKIGKIVEHEWMKTTNIRPDMNLQLGEFVVMPNHFHAIIIIGENEFNVQTPCMASPPQPPNQPTNRNQFGPQRKNLASIIRGFKSAVTMQTHSLNAAFAWQSRFHDHVICNYDEYLRIEHYIINNPKNWKGDKFHQS